MIMHLVHAHSDDGYVSNGNCFINVSATPTLFMALKTGTDLEPLFTENCTGNEGIAYGGTLMMMASA